MIAFTFSGSIWSLSSKIKGPKNFIVYLCSMIKLDFLQDKETDMFNCSIIGNISVSEKCLIEMLTGSAVRSLIITRWTTGLRPEIEQNWFVNQGLTVYHGLLLHQSQLIIPAEHLKDIVEHLNKTHQGIIKCCAQAHESVWWPHLLKQTADKARCICEKE